MKRIDALILDAGGVLVHPVHGDWNIPARYRELMGDCARDIPGAAWMEACRAESATLREDVIVPDMAAERALRLKFLRDVAARMGWALDGAQLSALADDFCYNLSRYAYYPDALEMLNVLRGRVRLGMLSDAMPSFRAFVRERGLEAFFDAVVVSTEIGATKPDARMYAEICRRMGADARRCLFVDDRECNLRGAMEVGMLAVQMCRDGLPHWDGPWVRVLSELNAHLEGLL